MLACIVQFASNGAHRAQPQKSVPVPSDTARDNSRLKRAQGPGVGGGAAKSCWARGAALASLSAVRAAAATARPASSAATRRLPRPFSYHFPVTHPTRTVSPFFAPQIPAHPDENLIREVLPKRDI